MATIGVPQYFSVGSGVIASYDWIDLTTGLGYRKYYACASNLSAGYSYFLTQRSDYDADPNKQGVSSFNNANYEKKYDLDFDIEFNVPAVIANAYATLNMMYYLWASAGETAYGYVVVSIIHYDGSSETNIGTATSAVDSVVGLATSYFRLCFNFALTQKKFAIGDILRLTVEVWAKVTGASGQCGIYHDPGSRVTQTEASGGTAGTDLVVDIPFKIDIT